MDRRSFLQYCGGIAGFTLAESLTISPHWAGKTHGPLSVLGLGTADLFRLSAPQSIDLLRAAYDRGITLFDTASAYGDGLSEIRLGQALSSFRESIFLSSKTLARQKQRALADLQTSRLRLQTDCLDLWMIHDLRTNYEWEQITSATGVLHALEQAKNQGATRFTGLSAHRNPELILKAIRSFPFDFLMIPVSPADSAFTTLVLPEALARGIRILGIQVLGLPKNANRTPFQITQSIHDALAFPITSAVVGCESLSLLNETLASVSSDH